MNFSILNNQAKSNIKNALEKVFGKRIYLNIIDLYEILRFRLFTSIKGIFVNKNKLFNIENLFFKFPKGSSFHSYGSNFKSHEEVERGLVLKYILPNDSILELGGCLGVISCVTNNILHNKKNHVVVEPNKIAQEFLYFNRNKNNCEFQVENSIVSNTLKRTEFYVSDDFVSSTIFNKNLNSRKNTFMPKKEFIDCISFDQIIKKYNILFNTLIMDIEGHEYDFILENDLKLFDKLLIEFHPLILGEKKIETCKNSLINKSFNLVERTGQVEFWAKHS
jgi:FkbM family methyltransferase